MADVPHTIRQPPPSHAISNPSLFYYLIQAYFLTPQFLLFFIITMSSESELANWSVPML